jgi:hypothetical protein
VSINNPIVDLTAPNVRSWVYARANIGGWFFDADLENTHTSTLDITTSPIQLGSSVTDNAFMQPRTLSMNLGVSDTARSFIPGQFAGGSSRSVTAWQVLQQLQELRIPVQVYTRLGLYPNMLVATLTAQEDYTTAHSLRVTVDLQEVLVATVGVVQISANPAVTDNAHRGTQQPKAVTAPQQSLLSELLNGVGG